MQMVTEKVPTTILRETFTIIVPAYNEQENVGNVLDEICGFISNNGFNWKVIVSADGNDRTQEIVLSYSREFPFVSISKSQNRGGKGAAIKRVLDELDSEYIILMDADSSLSFETIVDNLDLLENYDCLVFSRYFNHNKIPHIRRLLSRGFNLLVKASLGINISDTQSGYKAFKTQNFLSAMNKVGVTNTFFDISLFWYLILENARIKEVEASYSHRTGGKFHPLSEAFGQGVSLLAFRVRHSRFYKYVPRELISLYYRKLRWI